MNPSLAVMLTNYFHVMTNFESEEECGQEKTYLSTWYTYVTIAGVGGGVSRTMCVCRGGGGGWNGAFVINGVFFKIVYIRSQAPCRWANGSLKLARDLNPESPDVFFCYFRHNYC